MRSHFFDLKVEVWHAIFDLKGEVWHAIFIVMTAKLR